MSEKMTLYYWPKTRATRPRWALEELGLPYELKYVDLSKREHKSTEYLQVHPLGQVPALKIGQKVMLESVAMVTYLADKYPEKKLAPSPTSDERLTYMQWLFYFVNNVEAPLMTIFQHTFLLPEAERKLSEARKAQEKVTDALRPVEALLRKQEYFLRNFSALDILAGGLLMWAQGMKVTSDFPGIIRYNERLKTREAYQRAIKD